MDFISWNDTLGVGVKIFDDEHKQLVQMINDLNHALVIRSTQKTMGNILTRLLKYTAIHFSHEEEYMRLYDYPGYPTHKAEHDKLTAQVAEFAERLKSGKASFSMELMTFLRDWLTTHILGSDKRYKDFFISKGVADSSSG